MHIVTTVAVLDKQISAWRKDRQRIAFVPTMGNLHAGHLALVKHAKKCGDKVVVSIFVNSLQFDRDEDLRTYPRTPEQDLLALEKEQVDIAFMPEHEEIYAEQYKVDLTGFNSPLLTQLCGSYRPGFFEGIIEVVSRLFTIVKPQTVVFGEKDYQQLIIVKQLVEYLQLPIQVEQVPTQREASGLALSSRNAYLNETERKQAAVLYKTLLALKEQIEEGAMPLQDIETMGIENLKQAGFRPDYIAIRDGFSMGEASYSTEFIVILAAAWLGNARLIDNVLLPAR